MMPVGLSAFIASTKDATGAWSWAKGFWKSARSVRDFDHQPVDVEQPVAAARLVDIDRPSSAIAWLISSAMPVAAEPPPRNRKR